MKTKLFSTSWPARDKRDISDNVKFKCVYLLFAFYAYKKRLRATKSSVVSCWHDFPTNKNHGQRRRQIKTRQFDAISSTEDHSTLASFLSISSHSTNVSSAWANRRAVWPINRSGSTGAEECRHAGKINMNGKTVTCCCIGCTNCKVSGLSRVAVQNIILSALLLCLALFSALLHYSAVNTFNDASI